MFKTETVEWIDIKNAALDLNLTASLEYSLRNGLYNVWLKTPETTLNCIMKETSKDGIDFATNFKANIKPQKDSLGKLYVRPFSADQSDETICFTSQGDDFENQITGEGIKIKWDASQTEGPYAFDDSTTKTIDINFTDPIRIYGGKLYWENGDLDCTGDCIVVCPKDMMLTLNPDGSPFYAPYDWNINWYARKIPMLGSCDQGSEIKPEAASEKIPMNLGWIIRVVIKKTETNTSFKGAIVLSIYRKSNV